MGLTPLHSAIYGYHASRVEETCQFIDELLNAGANAQIVNKVGIQPRILLSQLMIIHKTSKNNNSNNSKFSFSLHANSREKLPLILL